MKARIVYRLSTASLSVLAVVNVCMAVVVWRRLKSPVQLSIEWHEPAVVQMPTFTNSPPGVAARPSVVASVSPSSPSTPRVYSQFYRYFEVGGEPSALLNGKYVREGDVHAYGRVIKIYPERIYFDGGDRLDNHLERSTQNVAISTGSDTLHP